MNSFCRIVLASSTLLLAACRADSPTNVLDSETRPTAADMRLATQEIGDYHTKVMEHAFLAFEEERIKRGQRLTARQICNVLDVSLPKFMYKGKLHAGNDQLRRSALERAGCAGQTPFSPQGQLQAAVIGRPSGPRTDLVTESGMTPEGQALVTQLLDLTVSPSDDYDGFVAAITGIENTAANTLGQQEVEFIFQMSSLARQSAWYWNGNIIPWWVTLGGNPENCVGDVCVYTAYSAETAASIDIRPPSGGFTPRSASFPGPICIYTCSPSGRRIAKLVLAADVGVGANESLVNWITRRFTNPAHVINWQAIGIEAASASLIAVAGIAVHSWYF